MANLPSGLPYYLRSQLGGIRDDHLVDSLCPTSFSGREEQKSKITRFIVFFAKASEDSTWMKSHSGLREELLERAFQIYKLDTKYKDRLKIILQTYLPNFKELENRESDEVKLSFSGHPLGL